MGRPLVGSGGIARIARLAVNLSLNQQHHAAGQQGDFPFLPGDDIRQILDRAGQVGDAFFDVYLIGHVVQGPRRRAFCKGFLAPVPGAG